MFPGFTTTSAGGRSKVGSKAPEAAAAAAAAAAAPAVVAAAAAERSHESVEKQNDRLPDGRASLQEKHLSSSRHFSTSSAPGAATGSISSDPHGAGSDHQSGSMLAG
eukprot:760818-Hanusia_phi.AAC.5